jgi:Carboxypeptidase regulatory-like domain
MRRCGWILLLSSVLSGPALAQETRGNISGTVRDAQGVVPGATVTITSTDTGAAQPLVTNGSGYFEAPLLQPGNYQIAVTMTGYKSLLRPGIVVAVASR